MAENIAQNTVLAGAIEGATERGNNLAATILTIMAMTNDMETICEITETEGGTTNMPRYNNGGGYNGGYEMRRGGGRRQRDSRGRYMMGNHYDPYPYHDPIYENEMRMRGGMGGGMRGNMMNAGYGQGYGMQQMGFGQMMGGYPQERMDEMEMREWVNSMEAKDMNGNTIKRGEKFTEQQAMDHAKKIGVKFDKFNEKTYWATLNMLYSMFYSVIGDNLDLYARLAKAWLCNENEELMGDEKLYGYYCYIVCGE